VVSKAIGRPAAADAVIEDAVSDLERALDVLERHLDGRDWLLGAFSLADCALAVSCSMLEHTRLGAATRFPRVAAYRARFQARPSWTDANGALVVGRAPPA